MSTWAKNIPLRSLPPPPDTNQTQNQGKDGVSTSSVCGDAHEKVEAQSQLPRRIYFHMKPAKPRSTCKRGDSIDNREIYFQKSTL
jgi:hypothetical protein